MRACDGLAGRFHSSIGVAVAIAAIELLSLSAFARAEDHGPLDGAALDERIGARIPPLLVFEETTGRALRFDALLGGPPVILELAWFECRTICGPMTDGLAQALRDAGLRPGRDLRLATVTIDPRDTPESARDRHRRAMAVYGRDFPEAAWEFLRAEPKVVRELAEAVGFRFRWDPVTRQYAHPAALIVLTPDGRVSDYLLGVRYESGAIRAALELAGTGRLASREPGPILRCFQYVPALRRYAGMISSFLRSGASLSLVGFGTTVAWAVRRRRARAIR